MFYFFFFFNDTATTEIYTLSLHDALPISDETWGGVARAKAFFEAKGGRSYEAEVFARLGDVYFDETKYGLAVDAYRNVLAAAPLAPEAPKIQAKIVLAWSRDRQFDREAKERELLVQTYSEGTPWWEKNKGDPDLLATVRELSEKSLLRAASFHHQQAQTFKQEGKLEAAVAEYRVSSRAYGDYLGRFPHSKQAYELSYNYADCLYNALEFDAAARVYAAVRDDPADDRYESEAALSAVISWEGEITRLQRNGELEERKVLLSTDRRAQEVVRAEAVPYAFIHLVRDSDVLLTRYPKHEKAAPLAYKAGEVFYKYGDFDEARCRYEEIVSRWPTTEVAQFAANLIIESYLTMKDWAAVEQTSARLQSSEVAKNPKLYTTLQKFKLGGRFNRAMQLMDAKAWEDAAKLFLVLVAEEPKHEFADKALYNAASCFESARRFESALRLYERIAVEYSRAQLADEALFRVGYNAENTYDFDKAVNRYLALVENYPGSKHRKDALYNAARSLENLQHYDKAAAAFTRYASLYPDAEDAARTQFHAALVYGKMGDRRREVQALQDFVKRFAKAKEHELVVQSHLEIALAHKALGDEKSAKASYQAAVAAFVQRGLKPDQSPRAAAAAAEARFRLAEYDFERYDEITLPATTNTKKLKKALEAKLGEAKKVAPQYDDVMKYKRPDWILAAFYRKAFLLELLEEEGLAIERGQDPVGPLVLHDIVVLRRDLLRLAELRLERLLELLRVGRRGQRDLVVALEVVLGEAEARLGSGRGRAGALVGLEAALHERGDRGLVARLRALLVPERPVGERDLEVRLDDELVLLRLREPLHELLERLDLAPAVAHLLVDEGRVELGARGVLGVRVEARVPRERGGRLVVPLEVLERAGRVVERVLAVLRAGVVLDEGEVPVDVLVKVVGVLGVVPNTEERLVREVGARVLDREPLVEAQRALEPAGALEAARRVVERLVRELVLRLLGDEGEEELRRVLPRLRVHELHGAVEPAAELELLEGGVELRVLRHLGRLEAGGGLLHGGPVLHRELPHDEGL